LVQAWFGSNGLIVRSDFLASIVEREVSGLEFGDLLSFIIGDIGTERNTIQRLCSFSGVCQLLRSTWNWVRFVLAFFILAFDWRF
jgi:hypothetical protein